MLTKLDMKRLNDSIDFEDLLLVLGFENVNKGRASCLLHGGDNKTSFSWDDNYFHCFSCLRKGDKIELVKQVKHCSFGEAIAFLSNLTGLVLDSNISKGHKEVDSTKREFPVSYVEALIRRTAREYYDTIIEEIEAKVENYTDILISMRNENVPTLSTVVENELIELDSEWAYWTYQRNQVYKRSKSRGAI